MTTLYLRKSIDRSPLQCGFLLTPLLLGCFALSPIAQAVSPPPDGGYPNANTAEGTNALFSLTTGFGNMAIGNGALYYNTTGGENTATGAFTLSSNTTGFGNTATGVDALFNNTTGSQNTANGVFALFSNTTASYNTANGFDSLHSNTTGSQNTATGYAALFSNTAGFNNTANGFTALYYNAGGAGNTAEGFRALLRNTGSSNIGLGVNAGSNLTSGSGNVCIGAGVLGVAAESNTTRIRNVYPSVASGRAVYVNSDNKLGTLASSRRFKDEIRPMDKASETILALEPVTFRYKKEIEPNRAIMFGLIAEEVEKVDPDLVTRNGKGEVETVRYDAVNAMLLNEFLKEHRKVRELEKDLRTTIVQQQKQIEALTATVQRMTDQSQLSKRAPQMVTND